MLIFDVETIPDTDLCHALTGSSDVDVHAKRRAMEEYHLNITDGKNAFLRQPFHRIIVISAIKVSVTTQDSYEHYTLEKISSGSIEKYSEKELVSFFFNSICKDIPRLITFNGKVFDLPVLKYRAMHYGIVAERFYKSGDKWNNYNNRYSSNWHCDLLEVLSDYGISARVKMNEVCAAFNLPGKIGVDGSDVVGLYDDGKISEIKDYCETDVLNTYLIYLRLSYHQGRISKYSYERNIDEVINYIEDHSSQNKSFDIFLEDWRKTCNNNFYSSD